MSLIRKNADIKNDKKNEIKHAPSARLMICYHVIRFIIIINRSVSASYTSAQYTVASFFFS